MIRLVLCARYLSGPYHGNLGFRFVAYAKHSSTFGPHKYTVLRTLRNLEQRQLSQSSRLLNSQESLKPSSQLEKTVNEIKETQQIADKKLETSVAKDSSPVENQTVEKVTRSQKIWDKVKSECKHYYNGFRLFFIDIKISCGLILRLLRGNNLNRREYNLLTKTLGDMFRLIPFSVFIIVPFMELLLPVFIKIFPNMLPSTFQKARDREERMKQSLKMKLEMAKILTKTLDEMVVESNTHYSARAKEFMEWFHAVKKNRNISQQDLMKFVKLFEDEITLESLDRGQLIALCRVLEISPVGNNYALRQYLRYKIRYLRADDRIIVKEGIENLNLMELQQAGKARGIIVFGRTEKDLREDLQRWLDLSLNEKVPASLLLLSRSLVLEHGTDAKADTEEQLTHTVSSLSESFAKQTKLSIGEKEGKVDNESLLNFIKEEEQKIKDERKEILQDKAKVLVADKPEEVLQDAAPVIETNKPEEIPNEHIVAIEEALDQISTAKKMIVEKEEIKELKEELKDYADDVTSLEEAIQDAPKVDIKESKAAKRLFNKVQTMIGKMDIVLNELEVKEKVLKKQVEDTNQITPDDKEKKQSEIIRIEEILSSIKNLQKVPDVERLAKIHKFLEKIDDDRDGAVEVEDVLKIIEEIGKDNVNLDSKQFDELIELLNKEELVEDEEDKNKMTENMAEQTGQQTVTSTKLKS